jgi:uncharacterized membrane protein YdfJ with MMPL/SSD domain
MHELSRHLYLAGGVPILLLGIAHVFATPLRRDKPRGLSPADPALIDAMSATSVRLTRRMDMWLGWVGFNLSHGLGAILFGVLTVLLGRSESSFSTQAPLFGPLAVLVSGMYLGLAVKYWFFAPIIGCSASFALFLLSWALFQFGSG